jgi:hypothetical protein
MEIEQSVLFSKRGLISQPQHDFRSFNNPLAWSKKATLVPCTNQLRHWRSIDYTFSTSPIIFDYKLDFKCSESELVQQSWILLCPGQCLKWQCFDRNQVTGGLFDDWTTWANRAMRHKTIWQVELFEPDTETFDLDTRTRLAPTLERWWKEGTKFLSTNRERLDIKEKVLTLDLFAPTLDRFTNRTFRSSRYKFTCRQ